MLSQNQVHESVEGVLAGLTLIELEEVPEGLGSVLAEGLHGEDAFAVAGVAHLAHAPRTPRGWWVGAREAAPRRILPCPG